MSKLISQVSRLKPELRLAQAVSLFETELSTEQKNVFRSYRSQSLRSPPDISDVMRLTAEIDRAASGKGGGRCFGPRFTNFLEVAQQFAALGDVILGGSQNMIACGVWSLLRMSLLSIVNSSSYLEKLSTLFMKVGRAAPRYHSMALLYPRSKDLQSNLSEYFIVVVRLCHQILKHTKQSALRKIVSTLGDSDIKSFQSDLNHWANSTKEEMSLLMATKIEEEAQQNSRARSLASKFFKSVSHQQDMDTRLRVLDFCSIFDHQTAWKQTRKVGNTSYFRQVVAYQEWKGQDNSCTLVYTGKLGSGKSVLLANIVDDLNIHVQDKKTTVAYFFCKHDISESLKARTVIGSLARQLLRTLPDLAIAAKLCDGTALDVEKILDVLICTLSSDHKAYFVLDGIDECDYLEREIMIEELQKVQKICALVLCISYRTEPSNASKPSFERFKAASFASISDANPEIEVYIDTELENCLQGRKLIIGEPTLILEIRDALLNGSQGMFLWVALQIQSLCILKTDQAIRDALADLPKSLSKTFARILQKSGESGKSYQRCILQLITAACRPLTINELGEALVVIPGDAVWNSSRLLNDVHSALACCGCLLAVDEEESTIRFVHHSVKQFLLGNAKVPTDVSFTIDSARRTMADIIITYLNYGVFGTEVSTTRVPPIAIGSASSSIIRSTKESSKLAQSLALKLLKSRKQPDLDISKILAQARPPFQSRVEEEFEFFSYANVYWLQNIFYVSGDERVIYDLLLRLMKKKERVFNTKAINEVDWTPLEEAAHNWHESIVKILLKSSEFEVNSEDTRGQTLLMRMARKGNEMIVKLLLEMDTIDINTRDQYQMTSLSWAARNGHEEIVKSLLNVGRFLSQSEDQYQMTPLSWAVRNEHTAIIIMLLDMKAVQRHVSGEILFKILSLACTQVELETIIRLLFETGQVDINSRDMDGQTPLTQAIDKGDRALVKLLLKNGKVDVNCYGSGQVTPLTQAIDKGDRALVRLLLKSGKVDVNFKESGQVTPFWRAIKRGDMEILQMLLQTGKVNFNLTNEGETPLLHAAKVGNETMVKLLIARPWLDANQKDENSMTALLWAVQLGHEAIVRFLLDTDKVDVNSKNSVGNTPLALAALNVHHASVQILLQNDKVDVNSKNIAGNTPLALAALNGHHASVQILLQNDKVDVNSKNEYRNTPLSLAAQHGYDDVVQILFQNAKVDVDSKNIAGNTPLALAALNGHHASVQILLQNDKVDVNSKNEYRNTPLSLAAQHGYDDVVQTLFQNAKVDVDSKNIVGNTPLALAAGYGQYNVIELLLQNDKIHINSKGYRGHTPLWFAVRFGHEKIVKLLLQRDDIDIDSKDFYQKTPLMYAEERGYRKITTMLEEAAAMRRKHQAEE